MSWLWRKLEAQLEKLMRIPDGEKICKEKKGEKSCKVGAGFGGVLWGVVGGSCGVGYVSLLGGTWGDLEELNLEIMFWDLGLTE